jgi:hypothetical protein
MPTRLRHLADREPRLFLRVADWELGRGYGGHSQRRRLDRHPITGSRSPRTHDEPMQEDWDIDHDLTW